MAGLYILTYVYMYVHVYCKVCVCHVVICVCMKRCGTVYTACVHVYECTYVRMRCNCLLVLRTCVPLQIHSFSATDMDIGPNADLTYMIDEVATVPPGQGDYSSSFSLGGKSTTP